MAVNVVCPVCNKKVSNFMYKIKCCLCLSVLHKNCTILNNDDFNELLTLQLNHWSCQICNEYLFVFNNIDNDDLYKRCLLELNLNNPSLEVDYNRNLILEPFDLNEGNDDIPLSDLDPDIHFYNNLYYSLQNNSDYFDECSFNRAISRTFNDRPMFSLFHLNIRSLPANLSNMLCWIENLDLRFDIIGISETWLTLEFLFFIASHIRYKELTEYSINNDNLDCIF